MFIVASSLLDDAVLDVDDSRSLEGASLLELDIETEPTDEPCATSINGTIRSSRSSTRPAARYWWMMPQ
jgi:hypothetical protein